MKEMLPKLWNWFLMGSAVVVVLTLAVLSLGWADYLTLGMVMHLTYGQACAIAVFTILHLLIAYALFKDRK